MRSIQSRLVSGLLLSLILLLVVQWVVVGKSIQRLSEQYITSRLIHASDLLTAAIATNSTGAVELDVTRIDPVYVKPFSGYYYTITSGDLLLRSRSLWDEALPLTRANPGSVTTARSTGPLGQNLLVVTSEYTKQHRTFQITVAEDITGVSADIHTLSVLHAIVSILILAVLISVQIIIIRRSLSPLEQIRQDLERLEHGIIQSLDENVPREIFALVHEINLRVKAFQQRLQRSRHAAGNLAHALKRPLTMLNHICDQQDVSMNQELRHTIGTYTEEIRQIIERELKRARLAGSATGSGLTDVVVELKILVELLRAMYRDKALDIVLHESAECRIGMDREDFHELLGNILDNACKWAKHTVLINYSCDSGKIRLSVEDDGPGIAEEECKAILNRGVRLDEHTVGHGLGLAIVKDIVDQYHASIELGRSQRLGGLKITITL